MTKFLYAMIAACVFSVFGTAAIADATRHELKNYADLKTAISDFDPATTLLVFDNDDTISTMPCVDEQSCQYLGGAAWFDWQDELLGHQSPYRVADDFGDLLAISSFIFNSTNMQVTDPALPALLSDLTDSGMRLIVETARGSEVVNATERQLSALAVSDSQTTDMLALVRKSALTFDDGGIPSIDGPFQPCAINGARPVTYQQGVMYLAGQNKGLMLKCLLRLYGADQDSREAMPIRNVVFVDDTPKNVDNVVAAFQDEPKITVKAFHYSAFDAHKAKLTEGPEAKSLQDRAKARWEQLSAVVERVLQSPAF